MSIITKVLRAMPARKAYAHCDIPCGIYDPHLAQIAAHTVVRMATLINELEKPGPNATKDESAIYTHKISRLTTVKEEHAELAKRELRVLWGDYFKPEHVQQHPNLHDTFWKAMKAGSEARQHRNLDAANGLLKATQEIAEIFWKTKGAKPVRKPSRQTTGGEIVVPD
ncbi:MAG: superoxide dismutase, Ni [SAR202 cluster bacterium]|nr:superoxide dismutase, Ni [SAR202 cluster bacterium]